MYALSRSTAVIGSLLAIIQLTSGQPVAYGVDGEMQYPPNPLGLGQVSPRGSFGANLMPSRERSRPESDVELDTESPNEINSPNQSSMQFKYVPMQHTLFIIWANSLVAALSYLNFF
jgi:hypothetical protein